MTKGWKRTTAPQNMYSKRLQGKCVVYLVQTELVFGILQLQTV